MLKNKINLKSVILNIFISGFVAVFVFNFMISNIFDSGKIFKSGELLEMQFVDVEDRSWDETLLNFWNKVFFLSLKVLTSLDCITKNMSNL